VSHSSAPTQELERDPIDKRTGDVIAFAPPRLPYHPAIQDRFGIDKAGWKALVEAVFPSAKSIDSVAMVLSYCKARNLDPFKKPVHIVPMWDNKSGGYVETVWPGIAELRTTAFRTGHYAGCDEAEFGPMQKRAFTGKVKEWKDGRQSWVEKTVDVEFPEWCRITVYRELGGRPCKFVGPKVKWLENYATIGNSDVPNEMWQTRPEGQLEKCAEAAALRKAFPEELGGELTAEEMEGRRLHDAAAAARDVTPKPPAPPAPPPPDDLPPAAEATPPAPPAEDKPKTTRRQRQHQAAAERAENIPPADTDPDGFTKWADDMLATIDDAADLETAFNEQIEPRMAGMFPPAREDVMAVYQKHERRLGGE